MTESNNGESDFDAVGNRLIARIGSSLDGEENPGYDSPFPETAQPIDITPFIAIVVVLALAAIAVWGYLHG
jgi:hypothetical protein